MTLAAQERELVQRYVIITDRHERLNAIIGHRVPRCLLPEEERKDEWLVRGCASRVWLDVQIKNGQLAIRYAAESVLIRGLVGMLVELYHEAHLEDVRTFQPSIFSELSLDQMLSPTRLRGLEGVLERLRHVD